MILDEKTLLRIVFIFQFIYEKKNIWEITGGGLSLLVQNCGGT
jgi:uncharacterized protein involved in tellurium resistance